MDTYTSFSSYPLFVYGSLLSGFYNHQIYLNDTTSSIEKGSILGYNLYEIPTKKYPAIYRVETNNVAHSIVYGEIMYIKPQSYEHVLLELDKLEDVENWYNRVLIDVKQENGNMVRAWVYECIYEIDNKKLVPSGDWRKFSSKIDEK